MARKSDTRQRSQDYPIGDYGVRIRMYRQGIGDCFLLRFGGEDDTEKPFTILIDCGVHSATNGGTGLIRKIAEDIRQETGGHIDIVVGTHEHWDHISGFHQAREIFKTMSADLAWLAWTEDNDDELAQKLSLKNKRYRAVHALSGASNALRMAGSAVGDRVEALLGFYGPGGGRDLRKAGDALLALASNVNYLKPGDAPIELPGQARVYVLGPPRDEKLIGKSSPSKAKSEVYEFGQFLAAAEQLERGLDDTDQPFARHHSVPIDATRGVDFFARHYWSASEPDAGVNHPRREDGQAWRRIGTSWLEMSESLALHLDHDTNNTSLVLAFELSTPDEDGPVMIFAADAQVGNWLGWRHHSWEVGGRSITGEDLMRRTILYKVGHHASHNATLEEHGLELMKDSLELSLIPTSEEMASKVDWGNIPWPALLKRLKEVSGTKVLRSDKPAGADLGAFKLKRDPLFYEISF